MCNVTKKYSTGVEYFGIKKIEDKQLKYIKITTYPSILV